MNASLIAANLTAHWIQAGLVSVAALLALFVFRVKEPRLKLALLQSVLAITLLLPCLEPWHPIEPVPTVTGSALVGVPSTDRFAWRASKRWTPPSFGSSAIARRTCDA
jgi:hypothetical protein